MASAASNSKEVFNLDLIYNSDFSYSLPKSELEKYLKGNAFDQKKPYTEEQQKRLQEDITTLFEKTVPKTPPTEVPPVAIMTCGGPGVGKTYLMRECVENLPLAYIDPDDVCLRTGMEKSYLADVESSDKSLEARKNLYTLWRPGSNAATHVILARLIQEKHPFYFGTTSSGPFTYKLLELLKNQGYQIKLLHVSAPTEVCWKSIQERDKEFVQTTAEDIENKALLVPQRINDTYLKYADTIEFYDREVWDKSAELAAVWIRNPQGSEKLGSLTIHNEEAYGNIKKIHDAVAAKLNKDDLLWENSVEKTL